MNSRSCIDCKARAKRRSARRGKLNMRAGIAFRARAPMSGPFAPLSCNKREDALSDGMEHDPQHRAGRRKLCSVDVVTRKFQCAGYSASISFNGGISCRFLTASRGRSKVS
ncbi:hypothetical protein PCAR4_660006 [Paraburkholderia caribensis]|nr:hypothetical protein PCAR4_660006 [Paraburkholderia caribensis]